VGPFEVHAASVRLSPVRVARVSRSHPKQMRTGALPDNALGVGVAGGAQHSDEVSRIGLLRPPNSVVFGRGAVTSVGESATMLGSRVLVVTDEYLACGRQGQAVTAALERAGVEFAVMTASVPELPRESVEAAIATARAKRPDCIIGLGGGSSIDLAKIIALALSAPGPLDAYYGEGKINSPTLPVIAIPTTAGTGSEVTPVAVLSDPALSLKVGISSRFLVPAVAICDPVLTIGAPPSLTAYAGIDALAHAIEAYTAVQHDRFEDVSERIFVGGNLLSERFALHAVRSISTALPRALEDNPDARVQMLEGSLCAGLAFATAGTAAAHALQYPLGAATHTPHGLGVGMLLPYVMAFNAPATPARMARVSAALGCGDAPLAAAKAVHRLCERLGLPRSLQEIGVRETDLPAMAEQAAGIERLARNNPRRFDAAGALMILRAAWSADMTQLF
jgi:alcohol dehydrogenase